MGRWYANGIALSHYAFNVTNRGAGWGVAARRGDNLVVPGRSGSVFNQDKPADVGAFSLSMWAVGANYDGSMPEDKNRRAAVREHLDRLSQIFGAQNLIEVARTDDDDVEYGRRNLIPNPSFEATLGDTIVRENRVVNGSAEYTTGEYPIRRNLLHAPSFERPLGKTRHRVNLVPNPRMASQGGDRVVRRNLLPNPSFEANLKLWAPQGQTELTRKRRDIGGRGPWVAHAECRSAGNSSINGGVAEVTPGNQYAVQVKCENRADVARNMRLAVRWWAIPGGPISLVPVENVSVAADGGQATLSGVVTAPAKARWGLVRLSQMDAAVGDVALWDEILFEEGSVVGEYFDGSGPDNDGLRYRWTDDSGMSVAEEYRTMPRGYTVTGGPLGGLSEKESRRGHQSVKVWLPTAEAAGTRLIQTDGDLSPEVGELREVSASVAVKLAAFLDETPRTVQLRLRCFDRNGEFIAPATMTGDEIQTVGPTAATAGTFTLSFEGVATWALDYNATAADIEAALIATPGIAAGEVAVTGGPVNVSAVTVTFTGGKAQQDVAELVPDSTGLTGGTVAVTTTQQGGSTVEAAADQVIDGTGWTTVRLDAAQTVENTAKVAVWVGTGDAWDAGDYCYLDCFLLERASAAGEWFDGASKDDDTWSYDWADERHWSPSRKIGRSVEWWVTHHADGFQTNEDPRRGEMLYRLLPRPHVKNYQRMAARSFANNVKDGRVHTFSVYVRTNRPLSMVAELRWVIRGQGQQSDLGTPVLTTAGDWTRVSVSGTCPTGATGVFPVIRADESPTEDDVIDVDCALLERASSVRDYFTGNSSSRHRWTGKPHRSESVYERSRPDGWLPYGNAHPSLYRLKTVNSSHGEHCVVAVARDAGSCGITAGVTKVDGDDPYTFAVDVRPSTTLNHTVGILWRSAKNEIISRTEAVVSGIGGAWTRAAVTGDPPPNAAHAAGYCYAQAAPDDELRFDAALFGFGGATDYKDGDNLSGWKWVGEKGLSRSNEYGEAVLYWRGWDGTLEQSAAWSSDRGNSGLFVVTDPTNPRIAPHVPLDWDDRQFQVTEGETVTFAIRAHARDDCRVTAKLVGMTYDGYRYTDWAEQIEAEPVDLPAGTTQRLTVSGVPAQIGSGVTHVRCLVDVNALGGGQAPLTTGVFFDEAVASYGDTNTYIDGTMEWVKWTAGKDVSPSEVYGPARRCHAEVVAGIDMTSQAGGTRAEFDVEMQIPGVYWEDTWVTEIEYPIADETHYPMSLVGLKGGTAPIDDAIIEVHGPFRNMRIKDMGTGAWIRIDGRFREDQALFIDSGKWTVTDRKGRSRISQIRHGGHARLLPLTVEPGKQWPRLLIDARSVGADSFIRVRARRRYHIA